MNKHEYNKRVGVGFMSYSPPGPRFGFTFDYSGEIWSVVLMYVALLCSVGHLRDKIR